MASLEHIQLATIIKDVHKQLREDTRKFGASEAWSRHLKRRQQLQNYSKAMHELASTHWEENSAAKKRKTCAKENNRIDWSVKFCLDYFADDLNSMMINKRNREIRILAEDGAESDCKFWQKQNEKLNFLDVGSCYNPFSKYQQFNVTAIDIAPARDDVYECDFLTVKITAGEEQTINSDGFTVKEDSFDIVMFSLLLEYMPSSAQRKICCQNAFRVLRTEGILIIITPDSKHIGANAKLMKNWRFTLALMGFNRIKVEKLEHIMCMVFRKSINAQVAKKWAIMHKEDYMTEEINIPQDFPQKEINTNSDSIDVKSSEIIDVQLT